MSGDLSPEDLQDQRAELLPDREVLSLLTDPTSMQVPSLLGGTTAAPDTGAGTLASGASTTAAGAAHHVGDVPAGGTYSPTESATAG
ncbi:MAG TPA: hypothetical protein VHT97_08875 [Acidimicrobiales bacterium]|jgi:hypothetical protein|nr:hypothetical protein [Acidimicrobiales bacterium]